jgi:hypothetical protein
VIDGEFYENGHSGDQGIHLFVLYHLTPPNQQPN